MFLERLKKKRQKISNTSLWDYLSLKQSLVQALDKVPSIAICDYSYSPMKNVTHILEKGRNLPKEPVTKSQDFSQGLSDP